MKTPDEIKNALERCPLCSKSCAYHKGIDCYAELHYDALSYIQQLDDHIRDLTKMMPKWISVEERLPERQDASAGELVLCICADNDGKPCAKEIHAWHYAVVRRMAKCFTHWMPLPEPPKEGE